MSKVILITGTSSGFGRTIAEKLHSEGYTVIGTSRNAEKINYLVGGFLEKKIILKSLLPDKLFQKIIMKLYS